MNLYLTEPTLKEKDAYLRFIESWGKIPPQMSSITLNPKNLPYEEWLDLIMTLSNEQTAPKGYVPTNVYFLTDENNQIIGTGSIRKGNNLFILKYAGHIGYNISPHERNKGNATILLKLLLAKAKELGFNEVILTCDNTNEASKKVILKNGGIYLYGHNYDKCIKDIYQINL